MFILVVVLDWFDERQLFQRISDLLLDPSIDLLLAVYKQRWAFPS